MANTILGIVNRAMAEIGADALAAWPETTTEQGRKSNAVWAQLVEEVLRAHPWNCVTFRAEIGPTTKTPDLLANGSFTGNANSWTLGTGWAYSANTVLKNADGTGTLSQTPSPAIVLGKTYKLTYTISAHTVGTVVATLGGATGATRSLNRVGYVDVFTVVDASEGLAFTPSDEARFTIDTISLQEIDPPVWGYAYQFDQPTSPECLRVLGLDDEDTKFKLEGKKLVSDESILQLRYIGLPLDTGAIDVTYFDRLLVAAIVLRLEAALAYPLSNNLNLAKMKMGEYNDLLSTALSVDSQEGSADEILADTWINARQ